MRSYLGLSLFLGSTLAFMVACRDDPAATSGGHATEGGGGSATTNGGNGGNGNGGHPTTTTTMNTGGGGGTVSAPCDDGDPSDCPGADTECATRVCSAGECAFENAPADTPLDAQDAGDCVELVCDGLGDIVPNADPGDLPDDGNDCTIDDCDGSDPVFFSAGEGEPCSGPGNASICTANDVCVECLDGTDCPSGVCSAQFACVAAACGDHIQNGQETDVDCGGPACPKCALDKECITDADCLSGDCQGTCQPTCTDGVQDQDETDVDCGGLDCAPCAIGLGCVDDSDCVTGSCSGICDEYQLLISELRMRGPNGAQDDFVEIYNPLGFDVTLPADIQVASRSDMAASYAVRWTSAGETIPAHGHFLIGGSAYSGVATPDAALTSGITDKASVVLRHATTPLDAVCLSFGATFMFDGTYTCEGAPFIYVGGSSTVDRSFERLPGGSSGSTLDTGNNLTDFHIIMPEDAQNTSSPATP